MEILEEKDPAGFTEGRYGTREHWQELWLQADQGNNPTLDAAATTVSGYLDTAVRQLAQLNGAHDGSITPAQPAADTARRGPDGHHADVGGSLAGPDPARFRDLTEELDRVREEERREADGRIAEVTAERDDALRRAEAAAEQLTARLTAKWEREVRAAIRLRNISVAVAAIAVAGALFVVLTGMFSGSSTYAVQLASPSQDVTPDRQATFVFQPTLAAGQDWQLRVQLTITPKDLAAGCTYGARLTFHVEADGESLPSFTSQPGQLTMSQDVHLGQRGSRSLSLIVTRLATDPECVLQLSTGGSQATATT